MKYIKEFKIFESLRDDYAEKLRQIEAQKKMSLDDIKKQVDEYMNYILDDYQIDGYNDSISDTGGKFVIYYKNIKCKLDILEGDYKHTNWSECDEFISLLEKIFEMIEKELEVTVSLTRVNFLYDVGRAGTAATINNIGKVESHNIEHGLVTTIEKVKRWIDVMKNYKKGSIPEYHTLQVEIIVR